MEDIIDNNIKGKSLTITESIQEDLITTCKWGFFLSIMGFIGTGFIALAAIFLFITAATVSFGSGQIGLVGFIYLIVAGLYLIPTLNLLKFSRKVRNACESNDQFDLEEGISNLKSLFKFIGIMTIVTIGIYIIIFLFAFMSRF